MGMTIPERLRRKYVLLRFFYVEMLAFKYSVRIKQYQKKRSRLYVSENNCTNRPRKP